MTAQFAKLGIVNEPVKVEAAPRCAVSFMVTLTGDAVVQEFPTRLTAGIVTGGSAIGSEGRVIGSDGRVTGTVGVARYIVTI